MGSVIQKPTLLQRMSHLLKGFDGPLAFAVFMLACAGLLIMYSSGYDHGTRFVDHGRNMLLAGFIMFVVAQMPPQKLMAWAVPIYTVGGHFAGGCGYFWHHQKRLSALDQFGGGDPTQ